VPESLDVAGLQEHYVGYTVLRPLASAPVGRTMIRPPSALAKGFRVEATEKVDVLGRPLTITAMPFMSQDGQYLRCAHASAWMLLQQAHLAFGLPRRLPTEVHDATMGGDVIDRQLPSEGLSPGQLLGGLTTLGLAPKRTQLPATPKGNEALHHASLFASLCRHVNTNLPPIVMGGEHSWLVVGYTEKSSLHSARVTLYTHDDAAGPYLPVDTPWPLEAGKAAAQPKAAGQPHDEPTAATTSRHWQEAVLALPPRFYMTSDRAEAVARYVVETYLEDAAPTDRVKTATAADTLRYRTYGLRSATFKHDLDRRPVFDAGLATLLRQLPLPYYIWVVELLDTNLPDTANVVAQVLLDPTTVRDPTKFTPGLLAMQFPGRVRLRKPEYGGHWAPPWEMEPFSTGRPPVPWPEPRRTEVTQTPDENS
jgi:hypothetical protein